MWRFLSPLLVLTLLLGLLPYAAIAQAAAYDTGPGSIRLHSETGVFSVGAVIKADGEIAPTTSCPDSPGSPDALYNESDVWLVREGKIPLPPEVGLDPIDLKAADGKKTAILHTGQGKTFVDTHIAIVVKTYHGGAFNLIMDHCQDGKFDYGEDYVHDSTIKVTQDLTVSQGQIQAAQDAKTSFRARSGFCAYLRDTHNAAFVVIGTGAVLWAALPSTSKLYAAVVTAGLTALNALAKHQFEACRRVYLELANDPPDPQYEQLTLLAPIALPTVLPAEPYDAAVVHWANAVEHEAAVAEMLLRSMERYQGAQVDGRVDWQLIHARAVRNELDLLQAQIARSNTASEHAGAVLTQDTRPLDSVAADLERTRARIVRDGLTAEDRRDLLNTGFTSAQIEQHTQALASMNVALTKADMLAQFSEFRASGTALSASLTAWAAEVEAVIAELEGNDLVGDGAPIAEAGAPYSGSAGTPLTLDGSASTSPVSITAYDWDLDADGAFDDATGARPIFTSGRAMESIVGLRVTNDYGLATVGYAMISISDTNRAPTFTSTTPAPADLDVIVGTTQPFAVTVTDPDGEPVEVTWTLDGTPVANGLVFTYEPAADTLGPHVIEAVAANQGAAHGKVRHAWIFGVRQSDGDGDGWRKNIDCDDADPAVNPGATEVVGNGKDDDCNPATADAGTAPVAFFNSESSGRNVALLEGGATIHAVSSEYYPATTLINSNVHDYPWATGSGQLTNQWVKSCWRTGRPI